MAPILNIPADSFVYVHADLGTPWDVSTDAIEGALKAIDEPDPVEGDWQAATWTPGLPATPRILVGPGSDIGALDIGTYKLFFRVHDNPEVPVLRSAGLVNIT